MYYCNKQGGMGSWVLCQEALRHWKWLNAEGISLHLTGSLNTRVDKLRQLCLTEQEWQLHSEVALGIFQQRGEPWSISHLRERTVSKPLHIGVLKAVLPRRHLDWGLGLLYTFSPLPLLPRVLKKIKKDRAQVILLALTGRGEWYPKHLAMRMCPPIRLACL